MRRLLPSPTRNRQGADRRRQGRPAISMLVHAAAPHNALRSATGAAVGALVIADGAVGRLGWVAVGFSLAALLPVAFDKITLKVSSNSWIVSPLTWTVIGLVTSLAAKFKVPEVEM